jgi:hypothetical protein
MKQVSDQVNKCFESFQKGNEDSDPELLGALYGRLGIRHFASSSRAWRNSPSSSLRERKLRSHS